MQGCADELEHILYRNKMSHFFFRYAENDLLPAAYLILVLRGHLWPAKTICRIQVLQHQAVLYLRVDTQKKAHIVLTVELGWNGNGLFSFFDGGIVYGLELFQVTVVESGFYLF